MGYYGYGGYGRPYGYGYRYGGYRYGKRSADAAEEKTEVASGPSADADAYFYGAYPHTYGAYGAYPYAYGAYPYAYGAYAAPYGAYHYGKRSADADAYYGYGGYGRPYYGGYGYGRFGYYG